MGEKTQTGYVRVVRVFAAFLGRSPDQAEPEDLRRYQLHLAQQGAAPGKMNAAVSALRFFFKVTLDRPAFGERPLRCARRVGLYLRGGSCPFGTSAAPACGKHQALRRHTHAESVGVRKVGRRATSTLRNPRPPSLRRPNKTMRDSRTVTRRPSRTHMVALCFTTSFRTHPKL